MGLASAIFLVGCTNQPNVNKYINPKIKNQALKQQKFKEDSLKCQVFADNMVSMPKQSYYPQTYSDSGNFEMTNIATGQQYSGTYGSGGGFAKGLAAGSAVGSDIGNGIAVAVKRNRAWKYCMLLSGWHEK